MEKFLTFPVNQQFFQVHVLCWAATNACFLTHGICLNHRKTSLAIHAQCSIHHRHLKRPKLENTRRLRGIYFIDPDDEEFKRMMKNARRKLDIPMPAATPWKLQQSVYKETCCAVGEHKTKYACIVEGDESPRQRMEGSPHKNPEDHIAGKIMNSLSYYNIVPRFIPMPQAMKVPDAMAAAEKNGKNSRTCLLTKVRNKKWGDRWSKE